MRLLLVFSVSIWMAGGCLLGCGNTTMAANRDPAESSAHKMAGGANCHHAPRNTEKQPKGVPSFAPGPRGMMKDCPLATSATAIASKNSGQMKDPGRAPVTLLPLVENVTAQLTIASLKPIPPNRGPTYLRCCVLLI